ncbi:MAG: carboxypeptidase regulatory-like domain-containing protein, partial [Gammaproteobacteria bacterium]
YNTQTDTLVRTLATGSDGGYSVTLLPPGTYRIQVTATGFKQYRVNDVPVRINETTRHDAQMEVGAVQEAITVEATPSLVSTVGATTGQPIDSQTLAALPLPVPNFMFLLALSPGAAGEPPDVRSANRGVVDINVNGQRTSNNSVSIEGINVNDFNLAHFDTIPIPNPSAIQEFKVATSLYDASMGSKGGGAVTLVMKTGSKDWHGDAYWSHRNEKLNANEWFRNQRRLNRARLLQNVFGASGSGPVPLLGGFWFANYQGVRARNGIDPAGAVASPVVQGFPTAGDGTTSAALLAAAFPGLTPAAIDPIAVNILNLKSDIFGGNFFIPRPGQAGCDPVSSPTATFRCSFSKIAPLTDNQYTITYDRTITDRHRLAVRWFW